MRSDVKHLNPFALPSETNVRFTLLIAAAIPLTLNLGLVIVRQLAPNMLVELFARRTLSSGPPPSDLLARQTFLADLLWLLRQILLIIGAMLGLVGAMLGLGLLIYRTHPRWLRFRKPVRPLSVEQDPDLFAAVDALASVQAGLDAPAIELVGTFDTSNIHIFGLPRRYILRLGGKWRLRLRTEDPAFRTVILHELAHIVNGDIRRTYFPGAAWIALIALMCIPLVGLVTFPLLIDQLTIMRQVGLAGLNFDALSTYALPRLRFIYAQVAVTLTLVATVRASLLRVRELYADWRVALWGERVVLAALLTRRCQPRRAPLPGWQRLWRNHPHPATRLAALQEPARLFKLSWDLPFFVGFFLILLVNSILFPLSLVGLSAMIVVETWIAAALSGAPGLVGAAAWMALPVLVLVGLLAAVLVGIGYLVSGTLGLEIQRVAIADLARGQHTGSSLQLLKIAALVTLGVLSGLIFSLYSTFVLADSAALQLTPVWLICLTGLIWLWLVYGYRCSQAVLGTHMACPSCGRATAHSYAVGSVCSSCHNDLAPWLFSSPHHVLPADSASQERSAADAPVPAPPRRQRVLSAAAASGMPLLLLAVLAGWYLGGRGDQLAGLYQVQGSNGLGMSYSGTVRLTPSGETYQVEWRTTAGDVVGIGFRQDDILAVVYGPPSRCELVVYQQHSNTILDDRFTLNGWQALSTERALHTSGPATQQDLAGTYSVARPLQPQPAYTGTLTVTATYQLSWNTTVGAASDTALHRDNLLAATYSDACAGCGLVVYHIRPGGLLDDHWTVQNETRAGVEQAQRIEERPSRRCQHVMAGGNHAA